MTSKPAGTPVGEPSSEREPTADEIRSRLDDIKDAVIGAICSRVPPDFVKHVGEGEKEMLLAARSLIDLAIAKIDRGVEKARKIHEEKK